ncbi:MAG TPA: OmpH family outer membrane protein [Desulfobulbaceae bacterium]|nr:OmpH family outer membrane protein [Desulfobulbaceae bacterium]
MKHMVLPAGVLMVVVFLALSFATAGSVFSAETKIGVINMKKVLATSTAGKNAQKVLEKKMNELRAKFKKDEEALLALQKEIEKKSSAWSDEIKQQKAIEFQKKRRDLGTKQEDANLELKQLREKHLTPILKKLEQVVKTVAQKGGYTIVLPNTAVLYRDKGADITAVITDALNKALK